MSEQSYFVRWSLVDEMIDNPENERLREAVYVEAWLKKDEVPTVDFARLLRIATTAAERKLKKKPRKVSKEVWAVVLEELERFSFAPFKVRQNLVASLLSLAPNA